MARKDLGRDEEDGPTDEAMREAREIREGDPAWRGGLEQVDKTPSERPKWGKPR